MTAAHRRRNDRLRLNTFKASASRGTPRQTSFHHMALSAP